MDDRTGRRADRRLSLALTLGTAGLLGVSLALPAPTALVWNLTASVPLGLYAVLPAGQLHRGDLVAVRAPDPLARWLVEGGYLGEGTPLLKHVAGLPGQRVCRQGLVLSVDGRTVAMARSEDSRGRALPTWSGCRRVGVAEVLLLNPQAPTSLDGRYFGPLPRDAVMGRAVPLWTRGGPAG